MDMKRILRTPVEERAVATIALRNGLAILVDEPARGGSTCALKEIRAARSRVGIFNRPGLQLTRAPDWETNAARATVITQIAHVTTNSRFAQPLKAMTPGGKSLTWPSILPPA
jgi:hypothetical protein